MILLVCIIEQIVCMRQQFSIVCEAIAYFSQVRIDLLDNRFLLRWV